MNKEEAKGKELAGLSLLALGVVYGDIGTSPLYSMRECFHGLHAIQVNEINVLGVLSLIIWSLLIVVTAKYLMLILKLDNRGEGGILALLALTDTKNRNNGRNRWYLVMLGLFGASLLYGDGVITPAISVLSAVEGLKVGTPIFAPVVVPITLVILVFLFAIQRRGTTGVGRYFGPITFFWFLSLALFGLRFVIKDLTIFRAFSPWYAINFFLENGWHGFFVLGSVFLVMTGGEALYADMGHFGRKPIRIAWFSLVLPALLLNYLGQGVLLLNNPESANNPFYNLIPDTFLYPMVALATIATVIASQAVISGAYSLTMQAIQLGYLPRMQIIHTSERTMGQIYLPTVNWMLMIVTLAIVLGFRNSSSLAAAYGIAVSTTMGITTVLAYYVVRRRWRWKPIKAMTIMGGFLIADLAFLGANAVKILDGGWLPIVIGLGIVTLMTTWKKGRAILAEKLKVAMPSLVDYLEQLKNNPPVRVSGAAVFLTTSSTGTPKSLIHHLEHNKVLHEKVVLVTILTSEVPYVLKEERAEIKPHELGFVRIIARYGFMEEPHIPLLLEGMKPLGIEIDLSNTTFYLGRERLVPSAQPNMPVWQGSLFTFLSRNAFAATQFFHIPTDRVIEIGVQVEM